MSFHFRFQALTSGTFFIELIDSNQVMALTSLSLEALGRRLERDGPLLARRQYATDDRRRYNDGRREQRLPAALLQPERARRGAALDPGPRRRRLRGRPLRARPMARLEIQLSAVEDESHTTQRKPTRQSIFPTTSFVVLLSLFHHPSSS